MAFDIFGFSFGKKEEKINSPIHENEEDGSLVLDSLGIHSFPALFNETFIDEHKTIERYREMAQLHEVDSAVDDIINEAIITTENKSPVSILLDDVDLKDKIKEKVTAEFENVLSLLKFQRNGYDVMRSWYVDGRIYYHKKIDEANKSKGISKLIKIDPLNIKKVREEKKELVNGVSILKSVEEYFVYTQNTNDNSLSNRSSSIKVSKDSITYVHSGILDAKRENVLGFLHKAIKPMNQLVSIEDSTVIYRLARAPEKRVFYIDVGNLPKSKAEQYLKNVVDKYKNKVVYDPTTGAVKDKRHHQAMVEDYYLPRREGGRGTEVSTIGGGTSLGEMTDVEYFKRKFYKSLNIPSTRIESENTFNLGRASEITRDELKFGKFIGRMRTKFSELFLDILKTQLILKNIMNESEWEEIKENIRFFFLSDSQFIEMKESEILKERMENLQQVDDFVGKYFSKRWVQKNILRQSDEEIEEIEKQIKEEDKEKKIREFDPEIDQAPIGSNDGVLPEPENPGPEPEDPEREPPEDGEQREDE